MNYVRIPQERVGVVIGPKGETRRMLERRSGIELDVDNEENEVTIHDEKEDVDPVMVLKMQDIIKAIGRGFTPEKATRLFSDDIYFELMDIHEYVGKHKNHLQRVRSRIIGKEGRTRRIIEEQTGCDLAIYGSTVGIIGELEFLADARHAVDMILRGSEHANVYRFLERKRTQAKRAALDL